MFGFFGWIIFLNGRNFRYCSIHTWFVCFVLLISFSRQLFKILNVFDLQIKWSWKEKKNCHWNSSNNNKNNVNEQNKNEWPIICIPKKKLHTKEQRDKIISVFCDILRWSLYMMAWNSHYLWHTFRSDSRLTSIGCNIKCIQERDLYVQASMRALVAVINNNQGAKLT